MWVAWEFESLVDLAGRFTPIPTLSGAGMSSSLMSSSTYT